MILLIFMLFLVYFLLLVLGLVGLKWSALVTRPTLSMTRRVSVVVPFRNEEASIANLINDLSLQDFPPDLLEVVFVNDHSEDDSVKRLSGITGKHGWQLCHLPISETGKKMAIIRGISASTGDIIVTTDADCRLPSQWLKATCQMFDENTVMVLGGVRVSDGYGFFSELQAMEFSSLMGVAAVTAGLGKPALGNGANLAYLKSAFVTVNGYAGNLEVQSGDDEFLMRKMIREFPGKVRFNASHEAVVTALPSANLDTFIQQRLRWAGKWKHNNDPMARGLAVFVWLVQLCWLTLPLLCLTHQFPLVPFFILAGIKIFLEGFFLYLVSDFLGQRFRFIHFVFLQCFYAPYVVLIGMVAPWVGYRWKGRRG